MVSAKHHDVSQFEQTTVPLEGVFSLSHCMRATDLVCSLLGLQGGMTQSRLLWHLYLPPPAVATIAQIQSKTPQIYQNTRSIQCLKALAKTCCQVTCAEAKSAVMLSSSRVGSTSSRSESHRLRSWPRSTVSLSKAKPRTAARNSSKT